MITYLTSFIVLAITYLILCAFQKIMQRVKKPTGGYQPRPIVNKGDNPLPPNEE